MSNKFSRVKILLVLSVVVFFVFGFNHLTEFVSFDEHYWLYNAESDRIHAYWQAIADRDWEDTRINDKPGITLAWTAGLALLFENNPEEQVIFSDGTVKIFNPEKTKEINFYYRLPILLLSGLFAFYFFWIIKKITDDQWVALFSATLILLSPIIIGISQIVNPDSVFWIFAASAIFTFLAFLQSRERKLMLLTTLFFGLSMASKYVAIIFIPFFFLMMLTYYLFEWTEWKDKKEELRNIIINNGLKYIAIVAGGLLIFALMMPAVFVKGKYFYEGTIGFPGMEPIFWSVMAANLLIMGEAYWNKGKIIFFLLEKLSSLKSILPKIVYFILVATFVFTLINWLSRHRLVDLTHIPFDFKRKEGFSDNPFFHRFVVEALPLVFSLTPATLFAVLYLWIKGIFSELKHSMLVFILSAFIIIFYVATIQQGLVLTIRYSIVLYPLALTLAALALAEFFSQEELSRYKKIAVGIFSGILSGVLFVHLFSMLEQYKIIDEERLKLFYAFHKSISFVFIFLAAVIIISSLAYLAYKLFTWKKLRLLQPEFVYIGALGISLISILLIQPYYFSYANDLLPKKYIITGGWGYGGWEAAEFINSMPNAKEITVWTDSYGFCEFFVGKCIHKAKVKTDKYKIDYYYRTLQAQLGPNFPHPMDPMPEWDLRIDSRDKNFVKIHKAQGINEQNKDNIAY